jgi:hypothetical protein
VAAQRFRWEGLVDGEPVISAAVNWLMGEEHLDPPWAFGPGGERFEVEVTGDPGTLVTFKKLHPESIAAGLERNPGIVATALHCVNAVPYVVAARPGLLTYLDLPPVAGRAAADLHRDRRHDAGPGDRPGPRSKRLAGAYFATYGPPDSTLPNALTVLAGVADPDAVRRDRGLAEYRRSASSDIDSDHVCWAADVAQAVINAVANDLAHRADM